MAADAVLGPANADEPAVDEAMRAAYLQIANRRRTVPPAVALALLDPAATVVRVSTDEGEQFVTAKDVEPGGEENEAGAVKKTFSKKKAKKGEQ